MRRRLICFASFWLFVSSLAAAEEADPSAKDLLSLHGEELFETAKHISGDLSLKFSHGDLMAITAKLVAEEHNLAKGDNVGRALNDFFEAACREATPDQVQQLCELFSRLDAIRIQKSSLLTPLAAARINQEFAKLRKEGARPKFADTHPAVPEKIAALPKELINAWKACRNARQPFDNAFWNLRREDGISFYDNQKSFFKLIDDVMAGRGENLAEKLNVYQTYGFNSGGDYLSLPKGLGMFVSLLHDGRLAEAVGACLALPANSPMSSLEWDAEVPTLRIEFLKICGIDWEQILAGAEVDREAYGGGYTGWRHGFLRELAIYGSERAATFLGEMASVEKANLSADYIYALGAFIERHDPTPPGLEFYGRMAAGQFEQIKRVARDPISKEVSANLLQIVIDCVKVSPREDVASAAIELFTRMRGPKVTAALQSLAAHPSPEVAENATRVLRAWYEKVETRTALGPVQFQLYVNGEPAPKGMHLYFIVKFGDSGGGPGVDVENDGIFHVNRDSFVGPGDPSQKPTGVLVSKEATAADEPFFAVSVPVPVDLDGVTRVDVQTAPLQLMIDTNDGFVRPIGQQALIQFKQPQGPPPSGGSICAQFDVPLKGSIDLSSIQSGTYDLNLFVPGAERWHDKITVGPKLGRVTVKLRPGADLHVEIVPPGSTRRRVEFVLLHEGKEIDPWSVFDSKTKTYRGLACGNYSLHVPASRDSDWERFEAPPGPDEIPYRALDVPFTIAANSSFVDLGEVHLSPAR